MSIKSESEQEQELIQKMSQYARDHKLPSNEPDRLIDTPEGSNAMTPEVPFIEYTRLAIEEQYREHPTGCGGSFGELLCYEIHSRGLTFVELAAKWGISLPTLGELIHDHCKRMEPAPVVRHEVAPRWVVYELP